MKVLKVFSLIFLVCIESYSQDKVQGIITELSSDLAIAGVSIYNSTDDIISKVMVMDILKSTSITILQKLFFTQKDLI